MEQKKYDIFVSYSRKDSEVVLPIVKDLESQGYTVWIDTVGIESSEQFKKKIVRVISNSTVFVFFSSANSNASEWTEKEIGIAVARKKPIIPIKLDDSLYNESVEFDLINLDFADCASEPEEAKAKIQKSVITHCGIPQYIKDQKEHERRIKLEQTKLQTKYDLLQEQFADLCKKRNSLLQEMKNLGIDISEYEIQEVQEGTIKKDSVLEAKCQSLEQRIKEHEEYIQELERAINENEAISTQEQTSWIKRTWGDIREGYVQRSLVMSSILTICFIFGACSLFCLGVISICEIFSLDPIDNDYLFLFPSFITNFIAMAGLWNLLKMKSEGFIQCMIAFILVNLYFFYDSYGIILCSVLPMALFISLMFVKKKGVSTWHLLGISKAIKLFFQSLKTTPLITAFLFGGAAVGSFWILCLIFRMYELQFSYYLLSCVLFYVLWTIYLMIMKMKPQLTTTLILLVVAAFSVEQEEISNGTLFVGLLIMLSLIPHQNGVSFYKTINQKNIKSNRVYQVLQMSLLIWLFFDIIGNLHSYKQFGLEVAEEIRVQGNSHNNYITPNKMVECQNYFGVCSYFDLEEIPEIIPTSEKDNVAVHSDLEENPETTSQHASPSEADIVDSLHTYR